ncbi:hypothetical protein Tco_0585262, partial [Tanacetum coccineum]
KKTAVVTAVTTAGAIDQMGKSNLQVSLRGNPALDTLIEELPAKVNKARGVSTALRSDPERYPAGVARTINRLMTVDLSYGRKIWNYDYDGDDDDDDTSSAETHKDEDVGRGGRRGQEEEGYHLAPSNTTVVPS